MVELVTAGGFPAMTYLWQSTSHDGQVSSCRGGVVRLSINVPISIRLNRGEAYSDSQRLTTWSMFDTALVALRGSLIYVLYRQPVTVVNEPVSTFLSKSMAVDAREIFEWVGDRSRATSTRKSRYHLKRADGIKNGGFWGSASFPDKRDR